MDQVYDGAKHRHNMAAQQQHHLTNLAYQALYERDLKAQSFIVACIVVDSRWRFIVDKLMPCYDWSTVRDRGTTPIATGIIIRHGFCETILAHLPDLRSSLDGEIPENCAQALVLDDSGGTIYIVPAIPGRTN